LDRTIVSCHKGKSHIFLSHVSATDAKEREREREKNAFAVLLCIHYIKEKAFAHWHHCYSKGPCLRQKSLYISRAGNFFYEAEFQNFGYKMYISVSIF
jgi:hypothetical protein